MNPQEFVAKWQKVSLKEKSAAQEHFLDLCQMLDHPTPASDDPGGQSFMFEAGASKTKGGSGFADVWKKGCFAWEYKGKHANLDKAYQQLLQYREALENPPLLVVSDIDTIVIHTNFTNTIKRVYTLAYDDLLTPTGLKTLKAVFTDPYSLKAPKSAEQATEEAAKEFSKIAELLRKYGEDSRQIAHFLIRLLFCLFAEDIDLLPKATFTRLVNQTRTKPGAFAAQLRVLFKAMATGGYFGSEEIRHFDGGLFDDDTVLSLDSDSMAILAHVAGLDWSSIEPSVLGTLFERSLDPGKRSQLGAHYTSKEDILLIVEPVLMAPLRRRWAAVKAEAEAKAAARDSAPTPRTRDNRHKELQDILRNFADDIAAVKVLDPACGSGNFLYVALKQLLDLQKEVSTFAGQVAAQPFFPSVDPAQLYGIELNPYAQELAQATVWIGYIQWLNDNGYGLPSEPILKPLHNIVQMDAILAYDDSGRPVEPAWPAADVVIGNPPFLGDKKMRSEMGDKYVDDLRGLYEIPGQSDLVCYWFEKSRELILNNKLQRAGLLATQGIRGGANRVVLERIKQTGDIFWAQSDRNWVLDGATVHVSMVGFDAGNEAEKYLNNKRVEKINADLSSQANLVTAKCLIENQGLSFIGTQKNGPFDLTFQQAHQMLTESGNPNGRPNSDVIKPWINALDITSRPRNMWIIDFGVDMPLEAAAQYEKPFEYVRLNVKPKRNKVREKNYREKWWLFQRSRPAMRAAISNLSHYIATPMVSKHRIFAKVSVNVIPENLLVVIAREDDYFFGVLHSKLHELWSRAQGTQLREAESGQRYTPTTTFETFPFPWPPGAEPTESPLVQAIAAAAKELVNKRDNWLNPPGASETELKQRTLTNLYNRRPTWLQLAHHKLDEAVFAAYGWPPSLTDDEILERLLALNLERAAKQ
ncbi:MAG: hypothetical protein FOGNACKC_00490 [Anaerolineae bacterium]|nr:hypothetical protein [Anaerolineae bacterium]